MITIGTLKEKDLFALLDSSSLPEDVVESISNEADQYLQSLVENKTFSGSALLARGNQILLLKGYGCSEYSCDEKNNSETIYRIGSVTKPFTATLILRLLERRQLKLNNPLTSYFPDYPDGNRITIKHLLSNTSGIEDYTEMEIFERKCSENLSLEQLIDLFKNEPLKFKPGSKYSYSNSNVSLWSISSRSNQLPSFLSFCSFSIFFLVQSSRKRQENLMNPIFENIFFSRVR